MSQKESILDPVSEALLRRLDPTEVEVVVRQVEEAEIDELWSYVGRKAEPRWLWHAIL